MKADRSKPGEIADPCPADPEAEQHEGKMQQMSRSALRPPAAIRLCRRRLSPM
jgi:hypothetical protein